ncbi:MULTISPECIES: hypothetical protein [Pseudomonas]|uniref:hypothetical protein n=1 Tax=Pseudomonas TaxID=286 RepID=UPI000CD57FF4|nr:MULTISPECIES: hypothetical protein [Pseudomonas]RBH55815.1 hypothetical protein C3F00_017215 [Pseudomonas sp. MWU13-2860]
MKLTFLVLTASLLVCKSAVALDDGTFSGKLVMVVGNDVTTSDPVVAGSDWLSFQCDGSGCSLLPAQVSVSDVPNNRDSMEMVLQRLHFSNTGSDSPPVVEAWFRRDKAHAWLKPGPVLTFASVEGPVAAVVNLSTESFETVAAGRTITLMPLLDRDRKRIRLQLREPGVRQMLDDVSECLASPPSYLRWAGDLDGDGRPDYLIDYPRGADKTHAVLYLSSLAGPQQLVGSAAVFDSAVDFTGCDGSNFFGSE